MRVGREEIDAAEAVHLQVDEARSGDSLAGMTVQAHRGDPSIRDLDVATDEVALDERALDAEPQRSSAAPVGMRFISPRRYAAKARHARSCG